MSGRGEAAPSTPSWRTFPSLDDALSVIQQSANSPTNLKAVRLDDILVNGSDSAHQQAGSLREPPDDAVGRLVDALLRVRASWGAIPSCVELECLSLQRNRLGPDGGRHIRNYIEERGRQEHTTQLFLVSFPSSPSLKPPVVTNLRWLYLNNNNLGPEGARHIAAAIRAGNGRLQILDLKGNYIGAAGAASLASALCLPPAGRQHGLDGFLLETREVCGIVELGLRANRLGRDGAIAIADALAQNETLEAIDLIGNSVGNTGTSAIADAIRMNKTLKFLALEKNEIGNVGALALVDALQSNTTITNLDVTTGNPNITDLSIHERLKARFRQQRPVPVASKAAATNAPSNKAQNGNHVRPNPSNHQNSGAAKGGGGVLSSPTSMLKLFNKSSKSNKSMNGQNQASAAKPPESNVDTGSTTNQRAASFVVHGQRPSRQFTTNGSAHRYATNSQKTDSQRPATLALGEETSAISGLTDDVTNPYDERWKLYRARRKFDDDEEPVDDDVFLGRRAMRKVLESDNAPPEEVPAKYAISLIGEDETGDQRGGKVGKKREELGRGAFGVVYKGFDQKLKKYFAVKEISLQPNKGPGRLVDRNVRLHALNTFKREVNTHLRFRHPNIARLFVYHMSKEDEGGAHYLVFELAEKGTLHKFLQDDMGRQRLPWPVRLKVAFDMASALHHLHTSGSPDEECFHRDIKPENVCITTNFTAKLIDCGLAKIVDVPEKDSIGDNNDDGNRAPLFSMISGVGITGTIHYMDPKVPFQKQYIAAFDVYSMGIVFLELLTGRLQAGDSRDHYEEDDVVSEEGANRNDSGTGAPRDSVGSTSTSNSSHQVNLVDRYVRGDKRRAPRDVRNDVDKMAGKWDRRAIDEFAKIAVECLDEVPGDRPTTSDVAMRLRSLVATCWQQNLLTEDQVDNGEPKGSFLESITEDMSNRPRSECADPCSICPTNSATLTCHPIESDADGTPHPICRVCFIRSVEEQMDQPCIKCPVLGCACAPFTYQEISDNAGADMLVCHLEASRAKKALTRLENFSKNLEKLQCNQTAMMAVVAEHKKGMDVVRAALAQLGAFRKPLCPRLLWIIPAKGDMLSLYTPWKWHRFMKKGVKLYFVCEHSLEVIDPPLELTVTRDFMVHMAFFMKLTHLSMKAVLNSGLTETPAPEGYSVGDAFEVVDNFVKATLDKDILQCLDAMSKKGVGDKTDPRKGGNVIPRESIGRAYDVLAEKVTKHKRFLKWKDKIEPIAVEHGRRVSWVKSEYANILSAR